MKVFIFDKHKNYNIFSSMIADSFRKKAYEPVIIPNNDTVKVLDRLKKENVRILFSISVNPVISEISRISGIPAVHYEIDKILNETVYSKKIFSDNDFIFSTYKKDAEKFRNIGVKSFYMPFCYNIKFDDRFSGKYLYKKSFVGSIISEENNSYRAFLKILEKKIGIEKLNFINNLFENVLETQFQNSKKNLYILEHTASEILGKTGLSMELILPKLAKESASRQREYFLKNIPELDVFGSRDWEKTGWNNIRYHGSADQFTETGKIFSESEININITRIYALDGLSDRIFNVMRSRGFLISNKQEAISELFDEKKEVVMFENLEHLNELIDYYLVNETEREKIAETAYKKVINEHSFDNRIESILRIIGV